MVKAGFQVEIWKNYNFMLFNYLKKIFFYNKTDLGYLENYFLKNKKGFIKYINKEQKVKFKNYKMTPLEFYCFNLTKMNGERLNENQVDFLLKNTNLNLIGKNNKIQASLAQKLFYYHFTFSKDILFNEQQLKYICDNTDINLTDYYNNNLVMIILSSIDQIQKNNNISNYELQLINLLLKNTNFNNKNIFDIFILLNKFINQKEFFYTLFDKFEDNYINNIINQSDFLKYSINYVYQDYIILKENMLFKQKINITNKNTKIIKI